MALPDRNARRSDEAERARHISTTESVAFATMLLGLLNDADTVLHRLEHDVQPVLDRAVRPEHPTTHAPAPADHGSVHQDQHTGTIETPAVDSLPTIHANAAAVIHPEEASAALDASSQEAPPAQTVAPSPVVSSVDVSPAHASSPSSDTSHDVTISSPTLDIGASVHNLLDGVSGIVDTSLAAVSNTIASLSATVGQLTSTVTGTVGHLLDGLTGTVTGLLHDTTTTSGSLAPPTDLSGLASSADTTDLSGAAHHDGSLFDTAGAIPMSLLNPIPLQLSFLGQPTIDGHEPHDGAFSTLGGHHF